MSRMSNQLIHGYNEYLRSRRELPEGDHDAVLESGRLKESNQKLRLDFTAKIISGECKGQTVEFSFPVNENTFQLLFNAFKALGLEGSLDECIDDLPDVVGDRFTLHVKNVESTKNRNRVFNSKYIYPARELEEN